jgi:Holliday junction resolvase RusA-like endonuclease
MNLIYIGRVISKKNSKQWIVRGGRRFLIPSERHGVFLNDALSQLRPQIKQKFTGPVDVVMEFFIPGKQRADGDNLYTSMLDVLQTAGAIVDDIMVLHGEWTKYPGAGGWSAKIYINEYKGKKA